MKKNNPKDIKKVDKLLAEYEKKLLDLTQERDVLAKQVQDFYDQEQVKAVDDQVRKIKVIQK